MSLATNHPNMCIFMPQNLVIMVLYNVTVSLEPNIEQDWIQWMKSIHIPDVLKTGNFIRCIFSKIQGMEAGEITYSILYFAHSQIELATYLEEFAPALQHEHSFRYKDKFVAFRTILQVIDTQEA